MHLSTTVILLSSTIRFVHFSQTSEGTLCLSPTWHLPVSLHRVSLKASHSVTTAHCQPLITLQEGSVKAHFRGSITNTKPHGKSSQSCFYLGTEGIMRQSLDSSNSWILSYNYQLSSITWWHDVQLHTSFYLWRRTSTESRSGLESIQLCQLNLIQKAYTKMTQYLVYKPGPRKLEKHKVTNFSWILVKCYIKPPRKEEKAIHVCRMTVSKHGYDLGQSKVTLSSITDIQVIHLCQQLPYTEIQPGVIITVNNKEKQPTLLQK